MLHPRDRNTYFIDIDGTVLQHVGPLRSALKSEGVPLPNSVEALEQLHEEGHFIILCTGRPESYRWRLEQQLRIHCIPYHALLCGISSGPRIVVNDSKPELPELVTAHGVMLQRNEGFDRKDLP